MYKTGGLEVWYRADWGEGCTWVKDALVGALATHARKIAVRPMQIAPQGPPHHPSGDIPFKCFDYIHGPPRHFQVGPDPRKMLPFGPEDGLQTEKAPSQDTHLPPP